MTCASSSKLLSSLFSSIATCLHNSCTCAGEETVYDGVGDSGGNGVTARVRAEWSVRSPRRIRLAFREAALGDVRITPQLEAALAPAALPRTWLTHRLLLAVKEVRGVLGGKASPTYAEGLCVAQY